MLRESVYSRRKLRVLLLLLLLLLLLALGLFWWMRRPTVGVTVVKRMQEALSYMGQGIDTETVGSQSKEVREQFVFIRPDSVNTHYLSRFIGADPTTWPIKDGSATYWCADKEIVVMNSARYQACNDPGAKDSAWRGDTMNPDVFDTTLFQPWARFAWCEKGKIREEAATQLINGVENRVYSCRIPGEREAGTIWDKVEKGSAAALDRDRYIREVVVDITIWVRQTDGYIGRFAMKKTAPLGNRTVTRTIDYVYTDFNTVPTIVAPDMSAKRGSQVGAAGPTKPTTAFNNNYVFSRLEIADDDASRTRGLKLRSSLPLDTAMLYVYPSEQQWELWMQDTFIPLDVVFLDHNYQIVDVQTMATQPGAAVKDLTIYQSRVPALYALEFNAGLANKYGFTPGTKVEFR
jgi:uncharacterized membrane protein (UPF0127 family)